MFNVQLAYDCIMFNGLEVGCCEINSSYIYARLPSLETEPYKTLLVIQDRSVMGPATTGSGSCFVSASWENETPLITYKGQVVAHPLLPLPPDRIYEVFLQYEERLDRWSITFYTPELGEVKLHDGTFEIRAIGGQIIYRMDLVEGEDLRNEQRYRVYFPKGTTVKSLEPIVTAKFDGSDWNWDEDGVDEVKMDKSLLKRKKWQDVDIGGAAGTTRDAGDKERGV